MEHKRTTNKAPSFEEILCSISMSAFNAMLSCDVRSRNEFMSMSEEGLLAKGFKPQVIAEITKAQKELAQKPSVTASVEPLSLKQVDRAEVALPPHRDAHVTTFPNVSIPTKVSEDALRNVLLGLSTRTLDILHRELLLVDVSWLLGLSGQQLLMIPGVGSKTVGEFIWLQQKLRAMEYNSSLLIRLLDEARLFRARLETTIRLASLSRGKRNRVVRNDGGFSTLPEWSVLRSTLAELLCIQKTADEGFISPIEQMLVSDLGLSQDDQRRLKAIAIFPDDSLAELLRMGVSTLLDSMIPNSVVRAVAEALSSYVTLGGPPLKDGFSCDLTPILGHDLAVLLLGAKSLGREIKLFEDTLADHSFAWIETASERRVLRDLGIGWDALVVIVSIWRLRVIAEDLYRKQLPEQVYASFETFVDAYINVAATEERQRIVMKGRLGLLEGRKWTLEELGVQEGVTRERIRQIESKVSKKLQERKADQKILRLWGEIILCLQRTGGVADGNQLADVLCTRFNWHHSPEPAVMRNLACMVPGIDTCQGDSQLLVLQNWHCVECQLVLDVLVTAVEAESGVLNEEQAIHVMRSKCDECSAYNKQVTQLGISYLRYAALCSNKIQQQDGTVFTTVQWAIRYGSRSTAINAFMYSIGKPMHFTEVYQALKDVRLHDTISEHNVYAILQRDPLMLCWDRGTYIHRLNVDIPADVIQIVAKDVRDRLKLHLPFISCSGIYKIHRERLQSAGIPTESALYWCMRVSNLPGLKFPEYPYIMSTESPDIRKSVYAVAEDFVRVHGGIVTWQALRHYLANDLCISEQLVAVYIPQTPNLLRVAKGEYIHADNLYIDLKHFNAIVTYIEERMTTVRHISVAKVFSDKQISCKQAGISNPMMLYSLLQRWCSDRYALSNYPSIRLQDLDSSDGQRSGITATIIEYLLESGKPCSIDSLLYHFVDELGYRPLIVNNACQTQEILRYSDATVVHIGVIDWTSVKQSEIEQSAAEYLGDRAKAGKTFGLVDQLFESITLPLIDTSITWTPTLLGDLLCHMGHFRIIGPQRNAFISLPNKWSIETLDDLLYQILESGYDRAALVEVFADDMIRAGILQKSLTQAMLGENGRVIVEGSIVRHRELGMIC